MQSKLIEILVCPVCKGKLKLDQANNELICSGDKLAFPIKDGIPVMLEEQARNINE